MKIRIGNRQKARQKITIRKIAIATSLTFAIAGIGVIVYQLQNPNVAKAAEIETSYELNWDDPSTFTVTSGSIDSARLNVEGQTCVFKSPLFKVGGNLGDPIRVADISVRINQSGNLDGNDSAWVNIYVNGSVKNSFSCVGDSLSTVFTYDFSMEVQATSHYYIEVIMKNDQIDEKWQIKNGNITSKLRSPFKIPVKIAEFTGLVTENKIILLKWRTLKEVKSHFYTLERSADGVNFYELGYVNGSGTSKASNHYSFTDKMPGTGINFYRLKHIDYDSDTTLFEMIAVAYDEKQEKVTQIDLFPNPFDQSFSLKFNSEINQKIEIQLIDFKGRQYFSKISYVEVGQNIINYQINQKINPGAYYIKVIGRMGLLQTVKIMKN